MSPKHTIYCLGEVLLALDADTSLAHAESFRPRLGGDAAVLAQACAAQGGRASLLAQLGEDPFGHRAASTLAAAGVDTTHASFSRTLPTALLFEAGGEALSYRVRTAGLQFAPEQLEPGLFQPGDALLFASSGLCDSPLRYTHLAALTAARDAGALCCYLPRLAQAAPYWPQREALCQTALQFLDRADVLFLEESDLLLLFGSRELRTALFALFTGHVQLIFFYKKDRILAFTRSVMASAAKKDQSPALVLYRMEQMGIHVIDLPQLREHVLEQLLGNDADAGSRNPDAGERSETERFNP